MSVDDQYDQNDDAQDVREREVDFLFHELVSVIPESDLNDSLRIR